MKILRNLYAQKINFRLQILFSLPDFRSTLDVQLSEERRLLWNWRNIFVHISPDFQGQWKIPPLKWSSLVSYDKTACIYVYVYKFQKVWIFCEVEVLQIGEAKNF